MLGSGALRFLQRSKAPHQVVIGVGTTTAGILYYSNNPSASKKEDRQWHRSSEKAEDILSNVFLWMHPSLPTTHCEAVVKEVITPGDDYTNHLSEEEAAFLNTMSVYRRWLKGIKKQWAITSPPTDKFPNNVPAANEISALEMDLQMYQKGDQGNTRLCQDLELRIACYYIFREESKEQQYKGFQIIKRLTVAGHWDGICLYGTSIKQKLSFRFT
jgi:hypothetical protein